MFTDAISNAGIVMSESSYSQSSFWCLTGGLNVHKYHSFFFLFYLTDALMNAPPHGWGTKVLPELFRNMPLESIGSSGIEPRLAVAARPTTVKI